MGGKGERPRERSHVVRTGAESARLTELDRELAEQLANRARAEVLNRVRENGLLKGLVQPTTSAMRRAIALVLAPGTPTTARPPNGC